MREDAQGADKTQERCGGRGCRSGMLAWTGQHLGHCGVCGPPKDRYVKGLTLQAVAAESHEETHVFSVL